MPTILYADDEQEHRLMMQVILKNQGITFLEAANGQEAIDQIKCNRPDLILLDLFMPRIDGFGVLQTVKTDPRTQHIPIIILSAWPTGDNRERARNYGAADFIAKPYDPLRLVEIIQKHLNAPGVSRLSKVSKGDTAPLSL
jgi:CheY-like chemotaxis protein